MALQYLCRLDKGGAHMKLTFFGAAKAVTGSCHCVEAGGRKILVDCGLQQGRDERDNRELDLTRGISTT